MIPKVPLLVYLATLDHGSVSEDIVQCLLEAFPAVDDAQDLVLDFQPTLEKALQQTRAQGGVLC